MKQQKQEHELKSKLRHGDLKKIAEITGFAYPHVVNAFNGRVRLHPMVLLAAQKLIEARKRKIEELTSQYK
jgi:hypothetical protein